MHPLSIILLLKIIATVVIWAIPLLFFPDFVYSSLAFPPQPHYMFARLLGLAYIALCISYGFSLQASLQGRRLMGPIWLGIFSNGGACLLLLGYGLNGYWASWPVFLVFIAWGSVVATFVITLGLIRYGVFGREPIVD